MPVPYQLVIDCASPDLLAHFWAEALHYVIEPPPAGHDSWDDFYRSIGVPDDELGIGADSIADPDDEGPRIWFQVVAEQKSVKNRLESLGATRLSANVDEGLDQYAVAMADPEGNEFDVN
jgi:glyoxalase superfamily protein